MCSLHSATALSFSNLVQLTTHTEYELCIFSGWELVKHGVGTSHPQDIQKLPATLRLVGVWRWWCRFCRWLQVEKLILSDLLRPMVAFCRTSTHVDTSRLFPLFSAYLWIYVDDDTLPDLLMNWFVSPYCTIILPLFFAVMWYRLRSGNPHADLLDIFRVNLLHSGMSRDARWQFGDSVSHIRTVILCWVQMSDHSQTYCNQPPRPTQLPTLSGTEMSGSGNSFQLLI